MQQFGLKSKCWWTLCDVDGNVDTIVISRHRNIRHVACLSTHSVQQLCVALSIRIPHSVEADRRRPNTSDRKSAELTSRRGRCPAPTRSCMPWRHRRSTWRQRRAAATSPASRRRRRTCLQAEWCIRHGDNGLACRSPESRVRWRLKMLKGRTAMMLWSWDGNRRPPPPPPSSSIQHDHCTDQMLCVGSVWITFLPLYTVNKSYAVTIISVSISKFHTTE